MEKKEKKEASKAPIVSEKKTGPANPYFDPTLVKAARKKVRNFNWVEPGTFVKEAETVRAEAAVRINYLFAFPRQATPSNTSC